MKVPHAKHLVDFWQKYSCRSAMNNGQLKSLYFDHVSSCQFEKLLVDFYFLEWVFYSGQDIWNPSTLNKIKLHNKVGKHNSLDFKSCLASGNELKILVSAPEKPRFLLKRQQPRALVVPVLVGFLPTPRAIAEINSQK